MPGGQGWTRRGLRFSVRPVGAYRRWLRFPFFFEQTNYSFAVRIERTGEEDPADPWPDELIRFVVRFENGEFLELPQPQPPVNVGDVTTIRLGPIYVSNPGQTTIAIAEHLPDYRGLYSYRVRTEESLWVSGAVGLFAMLSLFAAIFVPICVAHLDEPPIVNNEIIIPISEPTTVEFTPTPSPGSTPGTATPQPPQEP